MTVNTYEQDVPWQNECQHPGGLEAAFDLAAYEGYMIARVKKPVNHSRIIQSISFLFRRHIGFSDSREDRKCVQSCNLTSIYSPLFVVLWK